MGSVVITNRTVSDPLLSAVTEHQGSSALLSVERNSGSFQLQQLLLGGKTTSEAYQGTIVPNDPMTGDHNRNRIASHCCTHCLAGPRLTDPRGNFTITHRVTIGDFQQLFPDSKLKRGSSQIETQTKTAPVPFEVFSQLFQRLAQQRRRVFLRQLGEISLEPVRPVPGRYDWKGNSAQSQRASGHPESPNWSLQFLGIEFDHRYSQS